MRLFLVFLRRFHSYRVRIAFAVRRKRSNGESYGIHGAHFLSHDNNETGIDKSEAEHMKTLMTKIVPQFSVFDTPINFNIPTNPHGYGNYTSGKGWDYGDDTSMQIVVGVRKIQRKNRRRRERNGTNNNHTNTTIIHVMEENRSKSKRRRVVVVFMVLYYWDFMFVWVRLARS